MCITASQPYDVFVCDFMSPSGRMILKCSMSDNLFRIFFFFIRKVRVIVQNMTARMKGNCSNSLASKNVKLSSLSVCPTVEMACIFQFSASLMWLQVFEKLNFIHLLNLKYIKHQQCGKPTKLSLLPLHMNQDWNRLPMSMLMKYIQNPFYCVVK